MITDAPESLINAIDLLPDAICIVDADGRYVYVSGAYEHIFGFRAEEVLGRRMIELVHPDDRERTLANVHDIMDGRPSAHFENRYLRKDGRVVHVVWSARWSEEHQVRVAVARDVTERKRAEAMRASLFAISEAAHSAADLLSLFERIHRIVGRLLPANNCFVALYDRERDLLTFPYYVDEFDQAPTPRSLDSGTLAAEVIRSAKPLLLTPDNRDRLPRERIGPVIGRDSLDWLGVPLVTQSGVIGALAVQTYSGELRYTEADMALLQFVSTQVAAAIERRQLMDRLRHAAQHDPLTDLPNRALFQERLRMAIAAARRDGRRLALLYVDLDGFKQVNDGLGHQVGDQLLRAVAQRLRSHVRADDTVARIGGDEFVVLLSAAQDDASLAAVADKLRAALEVPFELEAGPLRVTASVGLGLVAGTGADGDALLQQADQSMYRAKRGGGNAIGVPAGLDQVAGDS